MLHFSSFVDLQSLVPKMVETEKHLVFPLVCKLNELALLFLCKLHWLKGPSQL